MLEQTVRCAIRDRASYFPLFPSSVRRLAPPEPGNAESLDQAFRPLGMSVTGRPNITRGGVHGKAGSGSASGVLVVCNRCRSLVEDAVFHGDQCAVAVSGEPLP